MRHAYRDGYSVLPRLMRLGDASPFYFRDVDRGPFLAAKRAAVAARPCDFESDLPRELHDEVARFLVDRYPAPLDPSGGLTNLALQIQEDFAVVRAAGGRDWAAAVHVCLPSHWRPERVIGRSFVATHEVVPGMRLDNAASLVDAMIDAGPFERYVWGLQFDDRLDAHPSHPRAAFDPADPRVFVRVERQVTWGFPAHRAALFLIRPHLFPEAEVDRAALIAGLRQMTPEQRRYKDVDRCFDALCDYLGA